MKTLFLLLLYILNVASASANVLTDATTRHRYNFNGDWYYSLSVPSDFNPTAQQSLPLDEAVGVTLPRAWNEDCAFRVAIAQHPDSVVWYQKTFTLPASEAGRRVMIEFEGARQAAEVWLNGHPVGLHENGVMAFGFDLTPYLSPTGQPNTLLVRTDNSWRYHERATHTPYQWNNNNFNANYGGLPKNVWLHTTGAVFQTLPLYSNLGTTGTYVYGTDYDIRGRKVTVGVESQVANTSSTPCTLVLDVEVNDATGRVVAHFQGNKQTVAAGDTLTLTASHRLSGVHFWSWGYGYLYGVRTRLLTASPRKPLAVDDVVEVRTGFRKTAFKEGKIWLNDRVMMVHGYAQRTSNEWPAVGLCVPPWMSDFSNRLMVESGANMVRWMHVTPSRQDVLSADRVGLPEAMPAGDAEHDVEGRRWEQRVLLMRDAIIYNRNSPSILFYEGGNESISREHMIALRDLRDAYDPHGGRAMGSREMLDIEEAEYGGEMLYINKSGHRPMWAMEYCRDEGYRSYYDAFSYPYHAEGAGPWYRKSPADVYNHNADQLATEHIRRWYDYYEQRPGSGRRVSSGGVKIVFSDTNTHTRSEFNYRVSGVVDAMRIPKEAFYTAQVMWNSWVDIDYHRTHIIGHWDYPEGIVKPVYVVSTDPSVALYRGAQLLARSDSAEYRFLHTFPKVKYGGDTLVAVGYDATGRVTSSDTLFHTGIPTRVRLTTYTAPEGMTANGADMVMVEAEVVDAHGRRCPTDHRMVSFSLTGPAEWRGGIAKSPNDDNHILDQCLPIEGGVMRVLVRSTREAGTVHLTASAHGLTEVSTEWQSKPDKGYLTAGLSTTDPAASLPLYLARGETPTTPSYTDRFLTCPIASAQAGAHSDEATKSFDDNELSEWRNDGRLASAWITYTLSQPAPVSTISLKLTGWRRRSYPLEVFADSVRIWKGDTPLSLGYVTLPIAAPVTAQKYTIRLAGAASEGDTFSNIVELAQPAAGELDLFKAQGGDRVGGELRIVEVDFLRDAH